MSLVSESLRKFAELNKPEVLFGEPMRSGLGGKTTHVKNVVKIGMMLPRAKSVDPELLEICLQLHDIGRKVQWEANHNFNDSVVNHRYNALQMIEDFFRRELCSWASCWTIMSDVAQYHGVPHMSGFAHSMSLPYIELVSLADDIENGCIGALGYLEDEKARDDKGYITSNPERDQRSLKPELLGYLGRGEKFNKKELCTTYAEYFVFAAMLAVNACNRTGKFAKDVMAKNWYCYTDETGEHWLDAVDGYCRIFNEHLYPEDAKRACEIMRKTCR